MTSPPAPNKSTPPSEYRLPPEAYTALPPDRTYTPIVSDDTILPEITLRSLLVGIATGILFGAANAYLGLKVGLTVSASIPAAAIGVAAFRLLGRGSILETNIVQTIGSAGESLAAGVIFTLPVLYLWGKTPGFFPIFPLSLLGGLLGVLFMIPLRRLLVAREHGKLGYPEGTACAEVQVASQAGGSQARTLFLGIGLGALYTALQKVLLLWAETPDVKLNAGGFRTSVGAEVTPELLGVGYILGPRVASVMLAGGAIGWLVMIPLIYLFGSNVATPVPPESIALVADMSSFDIWNRYLRYIGAGAVAFGGFASLAKSAPTLVASVQIFIRSLRSTATARRTDRDLPFSLVGAGLAAIALLVAILPLSDGKPVGALAAIAVVVFSFFFVTVSSRVVGLIGSSANPVSGMTIATVVLCAFLFGTLFPAGEAKVAVLAIGSLVCISAAIAGDTSQDLKTGFLIGATPRNQQIAEIVGVVAAALTMNGVLAIFRADIIDQTFKAPQANLIKLVIDGAIDGNLPWGLALAGVALAACIEIMGLPSLAFAVGLYLPVHLGVPIMVGGLLRFGVETVSVRRPQHQREQRRETGILFSSGLVAGAALLGSIFGAIAFFGGRYSLGEEPDPSHWGGSAIAFLVLCATMLWVVLRRRSSVKD